jgi:hypothetical protein
LQQWGKGEGAGERTCIQASATMKELGSSLGVAKRCNEMHV